MNTNDSQDPKLHVRDNRLFNADGSLRDGVELTDSVEKPVAPKVADAAPQIEKRQPEQKKQSPESELASRSYAQGRSDIPAIDFSSFVYSLAASVPVSLGLQPHPATGKAELNLGHAQQTIDILGMIEEKTQGNLSSQESQLLQQILFELRMTYVEVSKK